jgi:O-antigen/teichoic acid export membrane protein
MWLTVVLTFSPSSTRLAWLLGIPLLITIAGTITFAFQGLEQLPFQNAIATGGALITAAAYFLLFRPGMFLGADLAVTGAAGILTCGVSWCAFYSMFGKWPLVKLRLAEVRQLLTVSHRYWIQAGVIYFYSIFQIPLIAHFAGTRDAGIFRSAFLLASGLELLFNSINSLLLPRLVVWSKLGLNAMWRKQSKLLLVYLGISIPIVLFLSLVAPLVYRLVLGEAFRDGIRLFQILIVGRTVVFVGQIYAWGLAAIHADSQFLTATIIGATFSVVANLIVIPVYGSLGAACVSVGAETLIHTYCVLSFRRQMGEKADGM